MANVTGGTLAPRQTAAARSLGAPKGTVKAPAAKGVTKAPSVPVNVHVGAPPKSTKAPAQKPAAPKARTVPNYLEGSLSENQIKGLGHNYEQQTLAASKAAYKPMLTEVGQNELGASERYGQTAGAANSLLSSVGQSQEASAKTFENQAATNALQQAKAIETSGQQQASMTAGYVSPELKAELQAEGQREAGAGAAGNTFAQNTAQAGGNLIAGLRGAAALRSTEGQAKLTQGFQKQAQTIQNKELAEIPKITADRTNYEAKIASENEKAGATNQGLGIKTQLANNTVAGTKSKIQNEAAKTQIAQAKLGIERAKGQSEVEYQHADAQYKLMSASDKKAYDEAQAQYKTYTETHPKQASAAEANKYASAVSTVQALATAALGKARTKGAYEKAENEIRTKYAGKISEEVLKAGLNLAYYGHLVGNDAANAYAHGLSPALKPAWFKSK